MLTAPGHWTLWRSLLYCSAMGALCAASFSAHAAVLLSPVTVSLFAPGGFTDGTFTDSTPISATDSVSTSTGITPGDGSNIGGWMLNGEFISFGDSTQDILLHIGAGADVNGDLMTGYLGDASGHARYEFTNLSIPNEMIVGFTVSVSGLDSPTNSSDYVHLLSSSSLSIDLDTLIFTDPGTGQSNAGANLVIDLLTRPNGPNPAPEPSSFALFGLALASLCLVRGRRQTEAR